MWVTTDKHVRSRITKHYALWPESWKESDLYDEGKHRLDSHEADESSADDSPNNAAINDI